LFQCNIFDCCVQRKTLIHGQTVCNATLISLSAVLSRSLFRELNSISFETTSYYKYVFENDNNTLISFSETTEYTSFTGGQNVQNFSLNLNLNLIILCSFELSKEEIWEEHQMGSEPGQNIVTYRPVARQRLDKHIPTEAYERPFLGNGSVNKSSQQ
jgi:hypothetical protein